MSRESRREKLGVTNGDAGHAGPAYFNCRYLLLLGFLEYGAPYGIFRSFMHSPSKPSVLLQAFRSPATAPATLELVKPSGPKRIESMVELRNPADMSAQGRAVSNVKWKKHKTSGYRQVLNLLVEVSAQYE